MIDLIVKEDFHGPTLLELLPVLENITGTIDIKWSNTKAEQAALISNSKRDFRLYVPDLSIMERSASALGLRYTLDSMVNEAARLALLYRKSYNWRAFTEGVGIAVSRSLITKISADAVRKGHKPRLAAIATETLLDGISPIDADVLLRLAVLQG